METCKRGHPSFPGSRYKDGKCKKCVLEVQRVYRQSRPQAMLDSQKRYRERNRDKERERSQTWLEQNPGKSAEYSHRWRKSHPGRVKEVRTRYREGHLEEERARSRLRRVDKDDTETANYIQILRSDPCSYCGLPHEHVDHIDPVSTGGGNVWGNFTSSCAACNQSKLTDRLLIFLLRRDV